MIAIFASLALAGAAQPTPSTDPEIAAVEAVIDRLHETASLGQGEAYFALYTPEARFVGTDATEHWTLPAFRVFADQYFSRGRGWTFHPQTRTVTIAPIECRCVAWFDETLSDANYGATRGSGVLRLTENGWKIEQYVLSIAVPNDRSNAVVAVIKGNPAQ